LAPEPEFKYRSISAVDGSIRIYLPCTVVINGDTFFVQSQQFKRIGLVDLNTLVKPLDGLNGFRQFRVQPRLGEDRNRIAELRNNCVLGGVHSKDDEGKQQKRDTQNQCDNNFTAFFVCFSILVCSSVGSVGVIRQP
jgi:hypothetical protein